MRYLKYALPIMLLLMSVPALVQAQPGRGNGGTDRTPVALVALSKPLILR